jgi:hypothetical protein
MSYPMKSEEWLASLEASLKKKEKRASEYFWHMVHRWYMNDATCLQKAVALIKEHSPEELRQIQNQIVGLSNVAHR